MQTNQKGLKPKESIKKKVCELTSNTWRSQQSGAKQTARTSLPLSKRHMYRATECLPILSKSLYSHLLTRLNHVYLNVVWIRVAPIYNACTLNTANMPSLTNHSLHMQYYIIRLVVPMMILLAGCKVEQNKLNQQQFLFKNDACLCSEKCK